MSRTLAVLDAFSPYDRGVTLRTLARRTGLPRSTVHRAVTQLVEFGALERSTHGVRLGMRMCELAMLVPRYRELRDAATPFLCELYETTHETAVLALPAGRHVVCAERVYGHRNAASAIALGRVPANSTALGKALLAFEEEDVLERMLAANALPKCASRTTTEPDALREQLARVRRTGLAFDSDELRDGLVGTAAPVFSVDGTPCASIGVVMTRNARTDIRHAARAVLGVATHVTRTLRHQGRQVERSLRPNDALAEPPPSPAALRGFPHGDGASVPAPSRNN